MIDNNWQSLSEGDKWQMSLKENFLSQIDMALAIYGYNHTMTLLANDTNG